MTRILVGRYHDLADFMQAWPALALLKTSLSQAFVVALVPSHAAPLAHLCPWLDDVVVDVGAGASAHDKERLADIIHAQQLDVSIQVHPNYHNANLSRQAKIPYRLGPAATWLRFLYTHRFVHLVPMPGEGLHTSVVRHFLVGQDSPQVMPPGPYLQFPSEEVLAQRQQLSKRLALNVRKKWCFVQIAAAAQMRLSLAQYGQLLNHILKDHVDVDVVLCGKAETHDIALALQSLLQDPGRAAIYVDDSGVIDFARSVACANVFIGEGGGALHLAAALDVPTLGLFGADVLADPRHARPINSAQRHLGIALEEGGRAVSDFDVEAAYKGISVWLAQLRLLSTSQHI